MKKKDIPDEFFTGSSKKDVCMHTNNCKQYLIDLLLTNGNDKSPNIVDI